MKTTNSTAPLYTTPALLENKNQRLFVLTLLLLINSLIIAAYDLLYIRTDYSPTGSIGIGFGFHVWPYKVEFTGMICCWCAFAIVLLLSNNFTNKPIYGLVALFVFLGFILFLISVANNVNHIREHGDGRKAYQELAVAYWFASFVTMCLMLLIIFDCLTDALTNPYTRILAYNTIIFLFMVPYLAFSIYGVQETSRKLKKNWSSEVAAIVCLLCMSIVVYLVCCAKAILKLGFIRFVISFLYFGFMMWFWITNAYIFYTYSPTQTGYYDQFIPIWLYCGILLVCFSALLAKDIMDLAHPTPATKATVVQQTHDSETAALKVQPTTA